MKKYDLKTGFALFVLCGLMLSCSNSDDIEKSTELPRDSVVVNMLPNASFIKLSDEQKSFVKKNNDFSFNLYRAINESDNKKSNIISPISITYVLGMLNDGAMGATSQEITRALGFGENDKLSVNEFCKSLIEQASKADPAVTLQTANIVAANKLLTLEVPYINDMKHYYGAEVASLNFHEASSVDYLNKWCNEKSGGMIPMIAEEIAPETILALMNAAYFKATWKDKFDSGNTRDEVFTKEDGKNVVLPMMYRKARAIYGSNDTFSILCLPYGSAYVWEMYFLLPNAGKTVEDIIHNLNSESWIQSSNLDEYIVDVKIPRFSTRSAFQLKDVISKLGISSIFDIDLADLSGISKDKKLYVNKINQQAAIDVTEEGTKASSVTIAKANISNNLTPVQTADFHCDRPFVYLIREAGSGVIFFIGTFRGE